LISSKRKIEKIIQTSIFNSREKALANLNMPSENLKTSLGSLYLFDQQGISNKENFQSIPPK
jgi:hypothetical protein